MTTVGDWLPWRRAHASVGTTNKKADNDDKLLVGSRLLGGLKGGCMGVLLLGPNETRGFRLIRTSYLMEKMDGLVCPWPICRGGFDTLLVISSTVQSSPRSQVKQEAGINGKPIQAFTLLRRLVLMPRAQCNDSLPFA